ncbi:hypothetical protein HD806DRAFT_524462 [Xylariaceae sp. AK1471]|nr:hypothetical protein HD806DRAFT_524462 [Xylariaceae sp. AK1471]
MSELHSLKSRMDAKPRNPQPSLYLTELPISKRSSRTDGKAIKLVTLAVKAINELRIRSRIDNEVQVTQGSHPTDPDGLGLDIRKGYSFEYDDSSGANQIKKDRRDTKHAKYKTSESKTDMYNGNLGGNNHDEDDSSSTWEPPIDGPDVMIPLRSMYKGQWPIKNHPVRGAKQYSWSNVGFPGDSSLDLPDFEDETIIDTEENAVIELSQDITNIKTKSASKIADEGTLKTHEEYGCVLETFKLHGRSVVKIKIYDADVGAKRPFYSGCQVAREFERKVDACMRPQPASEVEQWVAAQFLLAQGGQIGGRTQDYWRRARDMAQQQLYVNPGLEEAVLQRIQSRTSVRESEDPALEQMLELVKKGIPRKSFNPYYQAQRDEFAVEKGLLRQVDAEIVLVLDKADNVIAFQCKDAFRELLCKNVEHKVAASLEAFSTRQPVPFPDMTRHGLHWIDWLRERPELDFRRPENDCRLAKSGVYHFGVRVS